jgi:broad specificity polyphosphatase/5'/3'-nucleotidase SurE
LILSTALSFASIINGTVQGIQAIQSIWKRLNKKKNQQDVPLKEAASATEETISMVAKKTESSKLSPENPNETRKQLVAIADLSESGDIKRIEIILPDGKVLKITPDGRKL